QRAADECYVLLKERAVEAKRFDQARTVFGSRILRYHQVDGIAGESAEKEHDCCDQNEQHQALQQSTRDEAAHQPISSEQRHPLVRPRRVRTCVHFFHGFWSGCGMRSNTSPSSWRPGMAANSPTLLVLIA